MTDDILLNEQAGAFSRRQQLFLRYVFFILIDIIILNLFNEYWDLVFIELFSISLLTAILLQLLLQTTIMIEHRVANFFKGKPGIKNIIFRVLSTWAVLFISKLVILKVISLSFGDSVLFSGPIHGLVSFIVVVTVIIVTEQMFLWVYRSLA